MTQVQFLEALDIDPNLPLSGGSGRLFALPRFPLAHIVERTGEPHTIDRHPRERIVLTYLLDDGDVIITACHDGRGLLSDGIVFLVQ